MDFLKLYPIKCLLTASIFCSLSFSENKSKPRYGFYTEENFGNYNFKYSTEPISDDPGEIVIRNYYKNFTSTGLGLSIIDSNYITVLGLRAGAITGEGYKFRDKDIYIGNTAEYAGYASENPVISQFVQGEAGKIIKDNMREKGKIYVGARPGSGFGKIKPGSSQRYIEPS